MPQQTVSSEVEKFLSFVGPKAYSSEKSLIDRLVILLSQRRGKDVDRYEIERILKMAVKIMDDKYINYLENAINNIKTDFAKFI